MSDGSGKVQQIQFQRSDSRKQIRRDMHSIERIVDRMQRRIEYLTEAMGRISDPDRREEVNDWITEHHYSMGLLQRVIKILREQEQSHP